MIKVFSSPSLQDVYSISDILGEHDIEIHIANIEIHQIPGALFNRTPDVWPTVYVLDKRQVGTAIALIQQFEKTTKHA